MRSLLRRLAAIFVLALSLAGLSAPAMAASLAPALAVAGSGGDSRHSSDLFVLVDDDDDDRHHGRHHRDRWHGDDRWRHHDDRWRHDDRRWRDHDDRNWRRSRCERVYDREWVRGRPAVVSFVICDGRRGSFVVDGSFRVERWLRRW
jgi:hypothetical protein